MPTATVRRSFVRGVVATMLVAAFASSSMGQDPVELHVVGRSGPEASATEDTTASTR